MYFDIASNGVPLGAIRETSLVVSLSELRIESFSELSVELFSEIELFSLLFETISLDVSKDNPFWLLQAVFDMINNAP